MLSLSVNTVKSLYYFSAVKRRSPSLKHNNKPVSVTVSASLNLNPSSFIPAKPQPQQQQLYQPFRPPPSPIPSKFATLDTAGRIEVLANRLGAWYEFAPLISSLLQEGFSPPSIEELTGISGVEQNRIVVSAQVRDSLLQLPDADQDVLSEFENGGAELLYEIRLLSASQRAASARFIVENKLDGKGANELARAIKDFPRRRGEKGWESFDYTLPGDCLAFMYCRQSREHKNPSEQRIECLEQALRVAETEKAKSTILLELEGPGEGEEGEDEIVKGVRVPVVRLKFGEVAEAGKVVVLPVCRGENGEREVVEAPSKITSEGVFGVAEAEKEWGRWMVLPGWEPVMALGEGGVAVSFVDARVLPWKVNRHYVEEPILVVADRGSREVVADDGFYLATVGGGLKVERGVALKENGVKESLGTVVLVVRPPKEDNDDQLNDEDWD